MFESNTGSSGGSFNPWMAAAPVVGGALSFIGQGRRAKKQHERNKELQDRQHNFQRQLNIQGKDISKELFDYTFMPIDKMKELGMNPAMYYSKGGGTSGTTTGSSGGGAAGAQSHAPMDITAITSAAKTAAEIKLLNAQADKVGEQTQTERGKLENIIGENTNPAFRSQLRNFESGTRKWTMEKILTESNKIWEEARILNKQHRITRLTMDEVIKQSRLLTIHRGIENEIAKLNIQKTKEEIDVLANSVYQRWTEVGIKGADTILKGILGNGGVGAIKRLMEQFKKK